MRVHYDFNIVIVDATLSACMVSMIIMSWEFSFHLFVQQLCELAATHMGFNQGKHPKSHVAIHAHSCKHIKSE